MTYLPVLIVGAGPTGLMMACELERHDIPFRIIDKKPEPTQGSNATWIQTRTLEIFDAIGMADQFLKIGHPCYSINFYDNGKHLANLPLNQIESTYPFILMLPQCETELLLTNKLKKSKIRVERSFELIDVKQSNNTVISTIKLPNGDLESVTSNWLVACDGANSTVREKCRIPFPGEDISEQFMVADAKMTSYLPTNEIHVFFDKGTIFPERGTIFSAFPWGSQDYRLSANLYSEVPRQTFHPHEVKEVVADRTYGNFIVENVSWISPFWIHGKIVDSLQHGSIFLAGDAGHIHSPAGGQGMNTGLQDAFNLAWKLALVIKGKAKTSLLESYQLERYSVVNKIVDQTERLTKMMLFDKTFFSKLHQFTKNISQAKTAKKVANELTQINIKYQNSPIIDDKNKITTTPHQGERAPDVIIDESTHLYQYLRNSLHNILIFLEKNQEKHKLNEVINLQQELNQSFPDLIKIHIVSTVGIHIDNLIFDKGSVIFKRYDVEDFAICVIRPDNYIGYFSKKLDVNLLKQFLERYLK